MAIAALITSAVILFGGAAGGKAQSDAGATATAGATAHVYFRPVLCFVPAYMAGDHIPSQSGSPTCGASSSLKTNLNVVPSGGAPSGFSDASVSPDPALVGVPSTKPSADRPAATVLLPGIPGACDGAKGVRCLLGPAEMTSRDVSKVSVTRTHYGAWIVTFTMSEKGAVLWDKVAQENFHQMLGIEADGIVYTAPIIQPTQSTFSSFQGKGEISGTLTKADALNLAKAMEPHSR